jgi:hypothetical protein
MYNVIRTWSQAGEIADAMLQDPQELRDLIGGVPGFVAYYASRTGDILTTITICETLEGTEESTRRAGDWVRKNLRGARIDAPTLTEGEVILQF